jgi:probable HAF family extracellular repeat protein
MNDLGTLGGTGIYDESEARGVNASGTVVGSSRLPSGYLRAVRWQGGTIQDLSTLVGGSTSNSQARAINDAGQIVGSSDSSDGHQHAALWSGGVVTDLGSLGSCGGGVGCSIANAINAGGDAVGSAGVGGSTQHPVLFHAGTVVDLGLLAGYTQGVASGINATGQIVGYNSYQSGETPGVRHGVLYESGAIHDLNDFVVGSGWQIDTATGIDDSGRIVGTGHRVGTMMGLDRRTRAILLTPQCASGPAFRSITTTTNGTTVSKPSGVVAGDLLLAALEVCADPVTVIPPAGWTLVRNQPSGQGTEEAFHAIVYKHVATANEPSEYTFDVPSGVYTSVEIAAYTGVSTVESSAGASNTGTSITAPSLTTSQANELLVVFYVDYAYGPWTTSSGLTLRSDFDSNSLQDALVPAAGPTGTHTASNSYGALAAISIALK